MHMRRLGLGAAALVSLAIAVSSGAQKSTAQNAVSMNVVKPETVGFSAERLENLHALIQGEIDRKQLAGAVTILARHGKIVDYRTYGVRDMATGAPMTKDTIFRVYSMSKPITGVAMMSLYEQGKWLPMDPIAQYIPEFAHLKVINGVDSEGEPVLVDPKHAPTMRELMTHSAGFAYGFGTTKVDGLYREAKVLAAPDLHEMIARLAKLPLAYQPGTEFQYSLSMDVEGAIVERLSGQSLPKLMHDRIFAPLEMKDSGFYVSSEKRARFATNYRDDNGKLVPVQAEDGAPRDYAEEPGLASGGGGLVSTAGDYYRFAQMLANGGQLNGVRILSPETVKLMTSNHLPTELMTGKFGVGMSVMRPGFGYGYNCAVITDPPEANLPDGKGTFFWDGAAGTWFWVDPANDIVFVSMIQRMFIPDNHELLYRSHAAVYSALVDPAK